MAEIEGLVRALREGDDAAKAEAAQALWMWGGVPGNAANRAAIGEAGGIPPLVELLRDGSIAAKTAAARALGNLVHAIDNNKVLLVEAGGVPPLVQLLRDGSAQAAAAVADIDINWGSAAACATAAAFLEDSGRAAAFAAGSHAKAQAAQALFYLSDNTWDDTHAVAIAAAVGFEALVQLAQRGRVPLYVPLYNPPTNELLIVRDAGVPVKRKAALVVAELLRDFVSDSVPREIKGLIGPYL